MIHTRHLIWDSWNVGHIARHQVTLDEVEQVCHDDPLVQQSYQGRLLLTGLTATKRLLSVVLAPKAEGAFYPVTARPADRKERRTYHGQKGGATS